MKVALLTFARTNNYGATLQCYALCKYIESQGHCVDIINIPLVAAGKSREGKAEQFIKKVVNKLARLSGHTRQSDYEIRYKRTPEQQQEDRKYDMLNMGLFDTFRSKYFRNLTHEYVTPADFEADYPDADIYIVGSDQVWNLWVTNIQYPLFFFSFVKPGKKKISYAPSMGGNTNFKFRKEEVATIQSLLDKFNAISVRDKTSKTILKNVFDRDAVEVLDPTFLIDGYDDLLAGSDLDAKGSLYNFKFIINDNWVEAIRFIAREQKLDIRMDGCLIPIEGFPFHPLCSVHEWLRLIKTSNFVFTDSFHGMVFSILFRQQFIATPSYKGGEERYMDLASKLGLEDRVYFTPRQIMDSKEIWMKPIDYDKVYSKLDRLKTSSRQYLLEYLK